MDERLGEYRFPNVLYVPHDEREAWLDRVFADVVEVRGWARSVELRFVAEGRRLLRFVRFVATAEELKHVLLVEAARVLRLELDRRKLPMETTGPQALRQRVAPAKYAASTRA